MNFKLSIITLAVASALSTSAFAASTADVAQSGNNNAANVYQENNGAASAQVNQSGDATWPR